MTPSTTRESILNFQDIDMKDVEYRYANGDVYIGDMLSLEPHGQGILDSKSRGFIYKGLWMLGKKQGKGICTYADGSIFRGLYN